MTSNLVELYVELADINFLKPYTMNARAHSRKQVRRIADSIKQFGFTNPLLIDELGEVIAGHGRLEAAQQLNLGQVPVIRLRHLDTAQKRALRLADNRIAELSSWTPELLTSESQFLVETDFAVEVTGFDTIDLDRILTPANAADDPDDAPVPVPPDQPTSRSGDIWLLGDHKLICGDARCLRPTPRCWVLSLPISSSPIRLRRTNIRSCQRHRPSRRLRHRIGRDVARSFSGFSLRL